MVNIIPTDNIKVYMFIPLVLFFINSNLYKMSRAKTQKVVIMENV